MDFRELLLTQHARTHTAEVGRPALSIAGRGKREPSPLVDGAGAFRLYFGRTLSGRWTVGLVDVIRVERSKFAEQWGGPDLFDLLQQLGAVFSNAAERN